MNPLAELLQTGLDTVTDVLGDIPVYEQLAKALAGVNNAFFIGRGLAHPIALEGAQKLKEISYIHAEAYPSSELKHGPLALVSPETPTIVAVPADDLKDKAVASIQEIKARRGPVFAFVSGPPGEIAELADHVLELPGCEPELAPVVIGVALQLLAYHTALALGRDIDQPRNLAKSVTVE